MTAPTTVRSRERRFIERRLEILDVLAAQAGRNELHELRFVPAVGGGYAWVGD